MEQNDIFTPVQIRRNSKAIDALIDTSLPVANAYPQVAAANIEAHADEAASKYAWSVRRDAYRQQIIAAMTEAWEAKRVTVAAANEQHAAKLEEAAAKYRARAEEVASHTEEPTEADKMYSQWQQLKESRPDHVLLICHGDFYETFGNDAVVVAEVCDMVLTARDTSYGRLPLTGVPYNSADKYIAMLVRDGHKVAIAERTDTESTRIVPPATEDAEEPTPSDTNEEEELRQRIEELEQQVKELEKHKKESERWYHAFEYMEEVEGHAAYGNSLAAEIDRAMMSLSNDGWNDTYTQKEIEQALKDALAFSNDASTLYDEYLQA